MTVNNHSVEIKKGERYEFGKNWAKFLRSLNEERIEQAMKSLQDMLGYPTMEGKTFLDVGSGSGLFSLAARRLGASVFSFDYDPQSVACTKKLKSRFFPDDERWIIETGSVLDSSFLEWLGRYDIVYSWGVLHHTGHMVQAFENIIRLVSPNGTLFISIYNDQGLLSRYWRTVKRLYNRNSILRFLILCIHLPYLFGLRFLVRMLQGRMRQERGMSLWYDMFDWLGGYPFEVAKPEEVFDFFSKKGYQLRRLKTCAGRQGCNEYVFSAEDAPGLNETDDGTINSADAKPSRR